MLLWYLRDKGASGINVFFWKKYLIISAITFAVLLNFYLLFSVVVKTGRIEKNYRENLENTTSELMQAYFPNIIEEINTLRSVLNLPPARIGDFSFETTDPKGDDTNLSSDSVYYNSFEILLSHYNRLNLLSALTEYTEKLSPLLSKHSITGEKTESGYIFRKNNVECFSITINNGEYEFSSFLSEETKMFSEYKELQEILEKVIPETEKVLSTADSEIAMLQRKIGESSTRNLLREKDLLLDPAKNISSDKSRKVIFEISRTNSYTVGSISYSFIKSGFFIGKNFYENHQKVLEALVSIETVLDIRTREELLVEKSISEIKRIANDHSFKSYLENRGFYLEEEYREESDHYYFDILSIREPGKRIGSFKINKYTGFVHLTDFDNVQLSNMNLSGIRQGNTTPKKKL